jgi:hypothetical protein
MILLRRSGRAAFLYCTALKTKLSSVDNITGGFLPHILFRGFYYQPAPRLKHNKLPGLFTTSIQNYYIAVLHNT